MRRCDIPGRNPIITRRRFLALTAGLAIGAAGVGAYSWRIEPHWIDIVERDLPIMHLPPALAGASIVQISDLHVGNSVDTDYLIDAMQKVSALRPAMTVITGDFMTCDGGEQIDLAARVLSHLSPGPLGCFAVLGNHDYTMGWQDDDTATRFVSRLNGLGIRTLRNEYVNVSGLQIVGIDDLWGPRFRPDKVVPYVDWGGATLTLCHNPDAVDHDALADCRGWILAGHTHGGQCKPPFLPPPRLPVKNKRYTRGEFDVGNRRTLYINRGLGYLRRVRFNARPEITLFRMSPVLA